MYILFDAQKLAFLIMNLGNNLSFSRAHLIQHKNYRYAPKITIEKMSGITPPHSLNPPTHLAAQLNLLSHMLNSFTNKQTTFLKCGVPVS